MNNGAATAKARSDNITVAVRLPETPWRVRQAKAVWRVLRLPFLTASVLPYAFGALIPDASVEWWPFWFGLAAVAGTHLAANLINEYADAITGADAQDMRYFGFFGGSKAIQRGELRPVTVLRMVVSCASLAALAVAAAIVHSGDLLIGLFFALTVVLAWAYSAPPLALAYHGWGEAVIGLLFGPATVVGAYYLQTGRLAWLPFFLSLPHALLVAGILMANEIPDATDDMRVGKRTLIARLPAARRWLPAFVAQACGIALIPIAVVLGWLPPLALTACLAAPGALAGAAIARRAGEDKDALLPASRLAVLTHTVAGVLLIVTLILPP